MIFKKLLDNIGKYPVTYLISAALFCSFFIFDSFWIKWINKTWVDSIASQIKDNTWWVVTIYSTIISAYYYHNFQTTEAINKNRCKTVVILTFLYCICLFSNKWSYVLICDCCKYLAWSNFIFIVPLFWELYIYCQLRHKRDTDENIEHKLEIEKTNNISDSYKRKDICKSIYTTLRSSFHKEGSFAFSITGIWGSGKTTFINFLKEQYNEDKSIKSIIIFEPWKNDTPDSIVRGFFTMLRNELSNYIPNISFTIDQYVELLLDEESTKPLKLIWKSFHNIFNKNKNPYEHIKEILEQTKHKTVVFIDDIDRLNANEIKEVLRLIRNTANLPYIQFIVAYDKNYVCEILKKDNEINTPERYLEKFFNVEMPLPKSEDSVICNELCVRLKKTINKIWGLDEEDTRITDMVYYYPNDLANNTINNNLIPQILYTLRDVIRFHNSFYLLAQTYKKQKIETEVCFQNLFFLELLKYRYLDIYTILCNKPFKLLVLAGDIFLLNENHQNIIKKILNDNEHYILVINILEYLFNKNEKNAISNFRNYYKYFMYRHDNQILTVNELMSLAEKSDSEIIKSANLLYKSKYNFEFKKLIYEILIQIFNTNEDNIDPNYTKIYSLLNTLKKTDISSLKDEISNAIATILQKMTHINKSHLRDFLCLFNIIEFTPFIEDYFNIQNFLSVILIKENLALRLRHSIGSEEHDIVYDFLSNTVNTIPLSTALPSFIDSYKDSEDLLISLSDLSDIQLKYFKDEQNKLSENGFILFHNCIIIRSTTKHNELNPEALHIMKEAIIKNPEEYFRKFIRTGDFNNPEYNIVSPEPCYIKIFGSNDEFEKFLNDIKIENTDVMRVKNYWRLYKNNKYNPIVFYNKGNVQEKIDNCFRDEIMALDKEDIL